MHRFFDAIPIHGDLSHHFTVDESVHPQRPRETLLAVESVHPQRLGFLSAIEGVPSAAGALFGLPTPKTQWVLGHRLRPPAGILFFLFKLFGDPTPKPADGFGGSTPNTRGVRGKFGGLGVD
jgi:hypothetical protein